MYIELIGAFLLIYTIFTLIVYVLVVSAVFLERKNAAVNAFYTIYMTGCFADTASLINGFLTYCVLTDFLHADWLNSQIAIKIMQAILRGSRFSQMITVLMIAVNRLTAVRYPLKYSRIWANSVVCACALVQVGSMLINGGIAAVILQPIRIPSWYGGHMLAMGIDPVYQKTVATVGLIQQTTCAFLILFFYIVILRDVQATLRKIPGQSNFTNEGNLHKIAFIVCAVEAVHQVVSTQFSLSKETATCIYIVRTALYNTFPPYLLIIFSNNVRNQVLKILTIKRRQFRQRIFSMDTYTT